ncbi:MAG: acyl transferase, partial [Flavobacteriales bacterium]|nr:acyl transferase [Flavobacteriales bacterium]
FFKHRQVLCEGHAPALVFASSGTTRTGQSHHHVADPEWYWTSMRTGFEQVFGPVDRLCILALLPSYLERSDSSLVYMVEHLMRWGGHPQSGFFLDDTDALAGKISELEKQGQATLLIGVTFALLDFAQTFPMPLQHTRIIETGGMKGRRRELTREEVHATLKSAFAVNDIISEYGMTELLSQAWSTSNGRFRCPAWMRILVRDTTDPANLIGHGRTGGINVIDLANVHSCSFIATEDLGKSYADGEFEVLGRFDQAEARGCALLTA